MYSILGDNISRNGNIDNLLWYERKRKMVTILDVLTSKSQREYRKMLFYKKELNKLVKKLRGVI